MSRDWNIVEDDGERETEEVASDETRLDLGRIQLIVRERRARDKLKLWRAGVVVTIALVVIAVIGWISGVVRVR